MTWWSGDTGLKMIDVVIGRTYYAAVSRKCCPVKIEGPHHSGRGWRGRNLYTNRPVHIKISRKLYLTKAAWEKARRMRRRRRKARYARRCRKKESTGVV